MDRDALIRHIRRRCGDTTQADFAASLGVSPAYLSDVLTGRREAGPKLLEALGLERQTSYFVADPADER